MKNLLRLLNLQNICIRCAICCLHSGTEKQHVADDYAKRLSIGQRECERLVADVASNYISGKSGIVAPSFQTCELLNVSICPATELGGVSGKHFCKCTDFSAALVIMMMIIFFMHNNTIQSDHSLMHIY